VKSKKKDKLKQIGIKKKINKGRHSLKLKNKLIQINKKRKTNKNVKEKQTSTRKAKEIDKLTAKIESVKSRKTTIVRK
jgi:hypothetical protein